MDGAEGPLATGLRGVGAHRQAAKVAASGDEAARDAVARDLAMIASGRLAAHHHIATYGTLRGKARTTGNAEAADLLEQRLKQRNQFDERFTKPAPRIVVQPAWPSRRAATGRARQPYSGAASPEPPNSAGKSFSFGSPSRIGSTVSA